MRETKSNSACASHHTSQEDIWQGYACLSEIQSSGVIEMLEKLLDKFIDERTTLEKEEMNSKHAYDMLMQDLTAQIAQGTQDRDEKAESKVEMFTNPLLVELWKSR